LLNGEARRVLDPTIREGRAGGTHAYLPSGNDDVLTPVLDAHRSIGVHDGQVTSMEVTAPENFFGSLVICEILHTRSGRKCQNKRITKGCGLSKVYLLHHKISANDNFTNGLPILRDILEVLTLCLINDTGAVGSVVTISLPGHALRAFFQGECQPRLLQVVASEWAIRLEWGVCVLVSSDGLNTVGTCLAVYISG